MVFRRYGGPTVASQVGEPTTVDSSLAQQALAAGRLVLTIDSDGLWTLRWIERSAAPASCLTYSEPVDVAYRLARYLYEEDSPSYVSVTLSDGPNPSLVSSTTSTSDTPAQVCEIALRCPDVGLLSHWASERFGATVWDVLDASTRVAEFGKF